MMKICKFLLLLIIFPLTGCSSAVALPTKTTTAILLTATNSSSVTNNIPTPPATIIMPTATPTSDAFRQSCQPILEHLPADAHASGTIINANANETFILNAQNGQQQRINEIDLRYGFFSIAPDGKHLAYFQYSQKSDKTQWLVIKGADGEQEVKIIAKDEWISTQWLDNDQLVFELQPNENELALPSVIFNPFTKQEQTLLAHSYPGLGLPDPSEPATSASGIFVFHRAVIYNPSLSLAIYRAFDKKLDEFFFVLWDREAKKTLAKIDSGKDEYGQNLSPIWSPSQNTFYFTNYSEKSPYGYELSEWFSISATGDVKQLTHLNDSFKDGWIGNRSLSPDGHYLAFWFNTAHSDKKDRSRENLMVLDLETLKVSAYCVPQADEKYLPVWSPDSQYVAISQVINLTNDFPMLMLSIQDGWLTKVAENKKPKVWWGGSNAVLPVLTKP